MKKICYNALLLSQNYDIMKITISAFLLSFSISNAQFNFGVRAGLTLSNQELSIPFENYGENKYSPYLGITGEYRFGKIAVASDITYLNLGSTGNVELRNNFDAFQSILVKELRSYFLFGVHLHRLINHIARSRCIRQG